MLHLDVFEHAAVHMYTTLHPIPNAGGIRNDLFGWWKWVFGFEGLSTLLLFITSAVV